MGKLSAFLLFALLPASSFASDFIEITKNNGKYFFTSKKFGNFFSVASNSFMEAASNEPMKAYFHSKSLSEIYEEQLKEYVSYGFNTLGGWSNTDLLNGRLAYTVVLFDDDEFPRMSPLLDCNGNQLPSGDAAPLPNPIRDPFDKKYILALQKYLKKTMGFRRNDQALLLYWVGHEFGIGGSDSIDFSKYLYSPEIQKQFKLWLTKKYQNKKAISDAWKSEILPFEHLVKLCPTNSTQETLDRNEFATLVLRKWFEIVVSEMRKVDPNHLISTPKLSIWDKNPKISSDTAGEQIKSMKGLFDLISVDWYTSNPEHSKEAFKEVKTISDILNLPVLVAEFGTRQSIKGWSNSPGAKALLNTQKERGTRYQSQLLRLSKENWIIGAHWFRWQDHITEQEQMNKGIVKIENGQILPYEDLKTSMIITHRKLRSSRP